jgi:hypothetical protein
LADEAEIVDGAEVKRAIGGAALSDDGADFSRPMLCHHNKIAGRLIVVKYFVIQSIT